MEVKQLVAAFGLAALMLTGGAFAAEGDGSLAESGMDSGGGAPAEEASGSAESKDRSATDTGQPEDAMAEGEGAMAEGEGAMAGEEATESRGSVARSAFAQGIKEREPVGKLQRLDEGADEVYYFTELRDMGGQTVTHRWKHAGEVKAEVTFQVGGPRWRVYSSKSLIPDWSGEWTVEVVNGNDRVVKRDTIVYGAD